jgi:threonine synthase
MRVTLGEGNTPLVESVRIGPRYGASGLSFKLENCNPSGSYKDRFIAAALQHMLDSGARACLATSSGNTGSALAAYCARYGVRCFIAVNSDAPAGKLAQMRAHGAEVLRIPRFVTDPAVTTAVFALLQQLSERYRAHLIVSAYRYCPEGMQGVESISAELARDDAQLDHVFVPVGGGGLYSAVARGFEVASRSVRIHAVQPTGCSTVVASFLRGDDEIRPVQSTTRVSGLSVPFDIDAGRALGYLRVSGGLGLAIDDDAVFAAQAMLLEEEGIYCEPAGAAALAGWIAAIECGRVSPADRAVCLVTGHGFKDPASIDAAAALHPGLALEPEELFDQLARKMGEGK